MQELNRCQRQQCDSAVQRHSRKFCGYRCYWTYRKENRMLPPSRKGATYSAEWKARHSLLFKSRVTPDHPFLKRTKEQRIAALPRLRGADHGNWNPDRNAIKNKRQIGEMREWRKAVFERDNYTCVECGNRGGKLNADHIKPYASHPQLRTSLNNGRTLCVECHKKTPTYGRRPQSVAA